MKKMTTHVETAEKAVGTPPAIIGYVQSNGEVLPISDGAWSPYTVGTTWVFFVPPGWLLAGTILWEKGPYIGIKDGVYLENVASGHALQGDTALATSVSELSKIVTVCWPLPQGHVIRTDSILHASPSVLPMTALHRRGNADAIKAAR